MYRWEDSTKRSKIRKFFTELRSDGLIPIDFYTQHEAVFIKLMFPKSDLKNYGTAETS